MIANSRITTTLPVVDINRAKKFYHETLGLKIRWEDQERVMLEASDGCKVYLYKRSPTRADHTVLSFDVEDIESEMRDLRRKGVKFEEYDMPEMHLETINGISTSRSQDWEMKTAWFKDTEGNILALSQMTRVETPSRREEEAIGSHR